MKKVWEKALRTFFAILRRDAMQNNNFKSII